MSTGGTLPCGIEDVVGLLGIRVVRRTETQLDCRCPFCDDSRAHLNVRLEKNVFRCSRCGQGGGVLHLYAAARGVSMSAAGEELRRLFADRAGAGAPAPVFRRPEEKCDGTSERPAADAAARNETYSRLLTLLSLSDAHRESLLARGLSASDIARLGYRTTPAGRSAEIAARLLESGCRLQGVPGFYTDPDSGAWRLDIRAHGIMIPDRNSAGEIEAIQIRLDRVRGAKYINLSSVDRRNGTPASCCPHFVGITDSTDSVILTEGVLKSDAAHCLSRELGRPCAFVGLTGVSGTNQFLRALSELKRLGITKIRVAFDMDAFTNANVMKARDRVLEKGREAGFAMTPMRWDPRVKGIDDLLMSFKRRQSNI